MTNNFSDCILYITIRKWSENESNEYVSLQSVMDVFTNNITYYDESSLFTQVVANTAMQKVNLNDYTYLSN